jgi:hypothetical protein
MKNTINYSVAIKPLLYTLNNYYGVIAGIIGAIPLPVLIGVPLLILALCLLWFWYNFLR